LFGHIIFLSVSENHLFSKDKTLFVKFIHYKKIVLAGRDKVYAKNDISMSKPAIWNPNL